MGSTNAKYFGTKLQNLTLRKKRRHDIHRNDIQHNDTQHNELICYTQHKWHSAKRHSVFSVVKLSVANTLMLCSVVMLNVVMVSVIMLNVVAPKKLPERWNFPFWCQIFLRPWHSTSNSKQINRTSSFPGWCIKTFFYRGLPS